MASKCIWIDSAKSTNSYLSDIADEVADGVAVAARSQTAGRGQRGNSWESEPAKNLTFSLMLRPQGLDASEQFYISEAVALGVVDALLGKLPDGAPVAIKWPNDIYWENRKICGILIENSLMGRKINYSIAGIGINVNQREFVSDAPNPVSLWQITGDEVALEPFLEQVVDAIMRRMAMPYGKLHADYMVALWGSSGRTYRDTATGEVFKAGISDVAPTGHITLLPEGDSEAPRIYAFKEVAVVL